MSHKLTKSFVDKLSFAAQAQSLYRDSELKGFGLRVGTDTKTYFAEAKVNGRTVRATIGKHGVFTAEQARSDAREYLRQMARGINPNDLKAEKRIQSITLEQVFTDFLAARKGLKPKTIYEYKRIFGILPERSQGKGEKKSAYLTDWLDKPIATITADMVSQRHSKIGQASPAQANLCMRLLRAVFNFASARYTDSAGKPLITENPVKRLSQTRAWYRIERRQSLIKEHQLKPWFTAVMNLKNDYTSSKREALRDYLLVVLFTGLRREEAARLTWANIDLAAKTLTVRDTKNREPHTLPLSDFLIDLFERRKKNNTDIYVFPGDGKAGYIVEPRKQMAHVIKDSGVPFMLHDLRRTFLTIADSLDIPAYAVKRLANHKMTNDVTAGYIVADVERLRKPMQKITDYILKAAGAKKAADILDIREATN